MRVRPCFATSQSEDAESENIRDGKGSFPHKDFLVVSGIILAGQGVVEHGFDGAQLLP